MEEQKENKAATNKGLLLDGWYGSLERVWVNQGWSMISELLFLRCFVVLDHIQV